MKSAALLASGATLALVVVFCLGGGSGPATTSYSPMEGKTIVSNAPPAPPPQASPTPPPAPKPVAVEKRRFAHGRKRRPQAPPRSVAVAPPPSVPAVSTQAAPVPAAAPPPPERPSLTYDAIADKYENDPSVYSMDRAVRIGDVTLHLEGLECLAEAFVLKVEVQNDSSADFYVKTFLVQVGSKALISRYFFRILVESQRAREGYVVFEKPQAGAAVKIKIEEEGGKGRAVSAAIPYPF